MYSSRRLLAALALSSFVCIPASAAKLRLDAGEFRHPSLALEGVSVVLGEADRERAELSVSSMRFAGHEFTRLRVSCGRFTTLDGIVACRNGALSAAGLPGPVAVDFRFRTANTSGLLTLRPPGGGVLTVEILPGARVKLRLERFPLPWLVHFMPDLQPWNVLGRISGSIEFDRDRLAFSLDTAEAGFANDDGTRAAEKLGLVASGSARRIGGAWNWQGSLAWKEGAAFWQPLFVTAGASVAADGNWRPGDGLSFQGRLKAEGFELAELKGAFPDSAPGRLEVQLRGADLAILGPRFIAPWFAPGNPDVWRFAGRFDASAILSGAEPVALSLSLADVGIAHVDGGLSAGPVAGEVSWQRGQTSTGQLAISGGRWRRLEFGAFEVLLELGPSGLEVERVRMPVLDSALEIRDLQVRPGEQGLTGSAGAVVEPLSMAGLTAALDLPVMSGVLSASIPRVRHSPGELSLDGALVISVFDGFLQATHLRLIEPLGRVPRLEADLALRHIDLGLLTDTFSFGRITGFLDGDVGNLELAGWRPISFDASFRSSPGQYPRRISQRAVQNISALGGAGAAAAIQRSFLGFFETFGYRRLGASCMLDRGVCLMAGLEGGDTATGGFTLIEGGGVPALNVIGYNRRVDWGELVGRLKAVIESNAAPVVQ